jgi:hypothetical protein
MINQNPKNVIFRFNGTNNRTLRCNWVKFGIEPLGEIDEPLNKRLSESWNDDEVRLLITLLQQLNLTDALWMLQYIVSRDKVIIIDGHVLEIVNDFKEVDFPLLNDSNAFVELELKFKRRIPGIPEWAYSSGYISITGGS